MRKISSILLFIIFLNACKEKSETAIAIEPADFTSIKVDTIAGDFGGGTLLQIDDFPSNYIPPRKVDFWLPHGYSEKETYAVIYMQDGQMLFDSEITWNHEEWMVDEVSAKLMDEGTTRKFIVVAPYNINQLRHSEYFPQKPFESLPVRVQDSLFKEAERDNFKLDSVSSDNYLKFLVKELKPYVDKHFNVAKNKKQTFVMGSSMGGLIAMYAICEYPNVFGGAACLSTHWPGNNPKNGDLLANAFFEYMKDHVPSSKDHKFYFDYGTKTLDKFYPKYAPVVDGIFKNAGYDSSNFQNLEFESADHSELSWQKRIHVPLTFLLKSDAATDLIK